MIELYVISSKFWTIGKPEIKILQMTFSGKKITILYIHPNDPVMFNFDIDADSFSLITEEDYALLLLQIN